jgi:integrase
MATGVATRGNGKRTRGKGEGSIYPVSKRIKGRNGTVYTWQGWTGAVEVGDRGKRKRTTVTRKLRADVVTELRRLQDQRDKGITPDQDTTVAEYLTWWLERVTVGKGSQTPRDYRYRAELVSSRLGHVRVWRLQVDDVERWKAVMVDDAYSAGTINEALRVLRDALDYGVASEKLPRNVASFVHGVKAGYKVDDTLTLHEANDVLALSASKSDESYALWWFALAYGVRPNELFTLERSNVTLYDVAEDTPSGGKVHGVMKVVDSKTESGVRDIPLTEDAATVMRDHLARNPNGVLVFGKCDKRRVGEWWSGLLAEAGVSHRCRNCPRQAKCTHGDERPCRKCRCSSHVRRFYCARSTAATLLLEAGVDIEIVAKILGHAHSGITMKYYAKVRADLQRQGLEATPLQVHTFGDSA